MDQFKAGQTNGVPKVRQTVELSQRQRNAWISCINKKDFTPSAHTKECSGRFGAEKPASLSDPAQTDRNPSLKMSTESVTKSTPSKLVSSADLRDQTISDWQLKRDKHIAAKALMDLSRSYVELGERWTEELPVMEDPNVPQQQVLLGVWNKVSQPAQASNSRMFVMKRTFSVMSSSTLDQEPDPPQIKEKHEEPELQLLTVYEPEPPQTEEQKEIHASEGVTQETDTLLQTGTDEKSVRSNSEPDSEAPQLDIPVPAVGRKRKRTRKVLGSQRSADPTIKAPAVQIDRKKYFCDICHKYFGYSGNLTKHKKIHSADKLYYCRRCGKGFNHKCILSSHMRAHASERRYSCETCGKCFSHPSKLSEHIRSHTGEKPYACKICDKCFSRRSNLAVHIRSHTGEKPYSCKTCGKCFGNRSHVTVHMRTHTGEKPYSCKLCGKCFGHRSNLAVHMRSHRSEKCYSCKTCWKKFANRSHLMMHMKTSHPRDKS